MKKNCCHGAPCHGILGISVNPALNKSTTFQRFMACCTTFCHKCTRNWSGGVWTILSWPRTYDSERRTCSLCCQCRIVNILTCQVINSMRAWAPLMHTSRNCTLLEIGSKQARRQRGIEGKLPRAPRRLVASPSLKNTKYTGICHKKQTSKMFSPDRSPWECCLRAPRWLSTSLSPSSLVQNVRSDLLQYVRSRH